MADKKTYILTISNRTALARNKRLREAGASVYINGSTVTSAGGSDIDEKGVVDVAVQGSGNVVTDAKLNSDGSTIVLNRGLTVIDEATANSRYLRKDQDDSTEYTITMGGAIVTGNAQVGGDLSITGVTRMTTAYVTESIGTPQYADGFDGYGWQLSNIGENNWHLTLDSLTVRKNMTVYEMIISKIRAIGGQFIVSAANGFIKSVEDTSADDEQFITSDGEVFVTSDEQEFHVARAEKGTQWVIELQDECEFVAHDLMRCQHYTGNDIKAYWVEIASVVNGKIYVDCSEFDDPLSGGGTPAVGDEVVLCGNTTDTNRQNLILISATEDGLPRIDVHQGVHEKSFNLTNNGDGSDLGTIRARLGSLGDAQSGIRDDWFPSDNQPQGYGLYAENAYLRGNFVLANTGENVSTLFQVIQGNITALITANESMNYLSNSSFAENTDKWEILDGEIVEDSTLGRNVLSLAMVARQYNDDYSAHPTFEKDGEGLYIPRNFTLSFWAKSSNGAQLRIDFNGEDKTGFEDYISLGTNSAGSQISYDLTTEYQYYEIAFLWSGTGDFRIQQIISSFAQSITAEIYDVKIVADNVTYFTTLFSQTVGSISALATRIDNLPDQIYTAIAGMYISVDDFDERIAKYVTSDSLTETLGKYVTIDGFATLFAQEVDNETGEGHLALMAAFVGKTWDKDLQKYVIESNVLITADKISLFGYTTINEYFTIDESGKLIAKDADFSGKITSSEGEIAAFTLSQNGLTSKDTSAFINFAESTTDYMYLSANGIDFQSTYSNLEGESGTVQTLISSNAEPATSNNHITAMKVTIERKTGSYGNRGIYIDVHGSTVLDPTGTQGNNALYIESGCVAGLRLHTRRVVDSDATLSNIDGFIVVNTSSNHSINLPSGAEDGQMIVIKHIGSTSATITVYPPDGETIGDSAAGGSEKLEMSSGEIRMFFYDYRYGMWHAGWLQSH